LAADYNLSDVFQCIGYPCRTIISIDGGDKYDTLLLKSYMQQELIRRGILWTAYHALTYSHSLEDIAFTLNCYEDVFKLFKNVLDKKLDILSLIEGVPVKPVFRKVADFNSYILKK
jgi:hypothetical protein